MSIIVWDGNSLAADKQLTSGNSKHSITKARKINGHLCGVAGELEELNAYFDYIKEYTECPESAVHIYPENLKQGKSDCLVITPNKEILLFFKSPTPTKIDMNCFAIGQGADAAILLMRDGNYSSPEVVIFVSSINIYCGMGTTELYLDDR